jgi:LPS export ABC transporter protein LptC
MIDRKKKLRLIQFFLLFFGLLIIYLTYYNKEIATEQKTISKKIKKKNKENISEEKDLFFNIEYSGFDLQGNRYLLKSEEAYFDELNPEIVYMKIVNAVFYFKDGTTLNIKADNGIYNNKTFDMKFEQNVEANYLNSQLFAEKAEYSNSKSFLSVYENVKINDIQGNLIADKLLFDITDQKLNITSFSNGKINANVNLNEKRF